MTVQEIVNLKLEALRSEPCKCERTVDEEGNQITIECDRCKQIQEWQDKCVCDICKECLELKIQALQEQPCTCTYKTVIEQQPSVDEDGNNSMIDVEVSVVGVMCARCIEIKGYQDTLDKWDVLDKANIDKEDYDKYDIVDGVICSKVIEEGKVSDIDILKTTSSEMLSTTLQLDFRVMEIEFVIEDSQPQPVNRSLTRSTMRGGVNMTPYQMMYTLILADNYDRADFEYKISVYVKRGRMTQEEADKLIAMMDAKELV